MKTCDGCRMPIRFWQSEMGGNHWYCARTRMNILDRFRESADLSAAGLIEAGERMGLTHISHLEGERLDVLIEQGKK